MSQSKYPYYEFSGALQQKTTDHIKKPNEVRRVTNVDFASVIGALRRRAGAQSSVAALPKLPINSPVLGAYIARFPTSTAVWAVQNNHASTPSAATLYRFTGPTVNDWATITATIATSAEVNMIDDVDEIWLSSYLASTDTIGTSYTINSAHSISTTRQLAYAPKARFFIEFAGSMWAADCLIGANRYRDRIYKSSGPTGVITFVRSAQTNVTTLEVDSARYLKVGMVLDIYTAGTESLNCTVTVTAVDKINDTITYSGAHTFSNKDEIWGSGRKNTLTRYWNTDYRNPEASDYIKIPATMDGLNAIQGVGKISNRMFIFTANSMIKFDGNNIVPLKNDVGCVAHRSINYYDSFMIWLDGKGNVWVRNEEAGSQDIISEAIKETIALVPQSQLAQAVAVCVDDKYKLSLGQIDGKTLRVVYAFRTNQWTVEWFTPAMSYALEYTYAGNIKPHFFDAIGQMWVDETGTDDNGSAIPMEVEFGNDNFGVDEIKKFIGAKIYSHNAVGTKVLVSIDDGDFKEVGQINKPVDSIAFSSLPKGTEFNIKLANSFLGDTPQINKVTVWYTTEEDTFRATS